MKEDIQTIRDMKLKCSCGLDAVGFRFTRPVCKFCWKGTTPDYVPKEKTK